MKKTRGRIHIVLRIKPTVRIRSDELDVIKEHNDVFDAAGSVAVGKFGAAWHQQRCDDFTKSIEQGVTTYLFIVSMASEGYTGFRAPIRDIFLAGTRKSQNLKFPGYYNLLDQQPSLKYSILATKPSMWFILGDRFKPHSLARLRLLSNGHSLLDVLKESRASTLMVVEGKHNPK
jgi:hypothetical protein